MTYALERMMDKLEEKGRDKGRDEMIIKMHRKNMPLKDIFDISGLPIEKIEEIIQSQNVLV